MTPEALPGARCRTRDRVGSVRAGAADRHVPIAAELTYRFTADGLELDPGYFATEQTHVTFQRADVVGQRLTFCVSRDEPRLAGERSGAGGPDQGLRIAERRGRGDRRARRVRRGDDRSVPAGARRRHVQRRRSPGLGHDLGHRRAPTSSTTTTTSRSPTASSATAIPRSAPTDNSRLSRRARTAPTKSTRGFA